MKIKTRELENRMRRKRNIYIYFTYLVKDKYQEMPQRKLTEGPSFEPAFILFYISTVFALYY